MKIVNGDYKLYFDSTQKRNIFVMGYFGGGAINFYDFHVKALEFSNELGCDIKTVYIDEIFSSRRFKGFKFIWSNIPNQKPMKNAEIMENVHAWLRD